MGKKKVAVAEGDEIVVKNKKGRKIFGLIYLGLIVVLGIILGILALKSLFVPTYELAEDGKSYIVTDVGDKQKEFEIKAEHKGLPVTEIGEKAFKDTKNLEKVVIPEGVTTIGEKAFENSSVKEVVFSSTVKELGGYCFQNCDSLESVAFPESLTVIAGSAFNDCDGLKEIVIPDTVLEIKGWAFKECDGVEKISIGKNVQKIGKEAFANCKNVKEIYFNAANCTVIEAAQAGAADQRPQALLPFIGAGRNGFVLTIGKDVTKVPDGLFIGYTKGLEEVIFEEGTVCTEIGTEAFADENIMESLVLPKSVTKLGEYVFAGCKTLVIYYEGTASEFNKAGKANWNQVDQKTNNSSRIKVYFYSEEQTTATNAWHYVDGVPTLWNAAAQN